MNRMIKRLLAAVLITSMLLGANGISYAAEIADGDSIAGTEEVTQEAVEEEQVESPGDAEASEPANEESAEEEQIQEEAGEGQEADAQTVEEAGAEASEEENENTAAEEEISESASEEDVEEAAEAAEDAEAAENADAEAPEDAAASENADAAAAELTAEEAAAAAAAAQAQEEVFTAGELVYHGHDYDVTLAYDENAKIPATAELKVREIAKGTSEYESYLAGAEAAAGKGVAEARFFDITIVAAGTDGQQQEIQPQSQVRVNITYHKALEVAAEGEVQAMHFEDGTADAEVVNTDTNGGSEVSEIAFDAESFSVYGIVYTVDFTYDGFTYCIEGGSSIYLSELAQILGLYETDLDKAFSVGNVSNVTFTDYDLVKIEKQADGDWLLISLAPFTSEETLTIEMNDGVTFIVDVTDASGDEWTESSELVNFLTNAVISGATPQGGAYVVEPNKPYGITLTFKEGRQWQFANHSTLAYDMPAGMYIPDDQTKQLEIVVTSGGITYEADATLNITTDGKLTIKFDESDPEFPRLANANNVSLRAQFNACFDGSETTIRFSDTVEKEVIIDDDDHSDAYATKSGTFDETTGTYHYTIKVKATGNPKNVNVKDVISGTALRFNNDVQIIGNSSGYTTNPVTGKGFDYTFEEMQDGEEITITYSASLDPGEMAGADEINADMTKNTVTVRKEDGEPHNAEYSHQINLKTPDKRDGSEAGTTADGNKIYNWTIEYNKLALAGCAGDVIKDAIAVGSQEYMKYYGNITVKVYDHDDNLVDTRSFAPGSDSAWQYTVPGGDTTPYRYVFEYQTVVDQAKVDGLATEVALTNNSEGPGGTDGGGVTVSPKEKVTITKEVVTSNTDEVTWISHIHVPEGGLAQAIVTDWVPSLWYNTRNYFDDYKDGSLVVDGLLPGESYDDPVVDGDLGTVTITFYKDSGKTQTGLQPADGGHDITIQLTTRVNQEWLEIGYEKGDDPNFKRFQTHTNVIGINGITAQAEVTYAKPDIKKTGLEQADYHYMYTLILTGVSAEPISIEDIFDTSILEFDSGNTAWNSLKIYGGNQWDQSAGGYPVNYSQTENGVLLTANSIPKQPNGEYYSHYKIIYYAKVKDGIDPNELAVENGGEFELSNTAKWGDHESDFKFTYNYDALSKELITAATAEDHYAYYKITFNPRHATLNNGQSFPMTDTLNKYLSIDHSSITITTDPAGVYVPYSISGEKDEYGNPTGGTVATYEIPDETAVTIEYRAMVVGTGTVTYKNTVEARGKSKYVEKDVDMGSSGGGEATQFSVKAVKVDGYDANKKLQGVKFKLYSSSGISLYPQDHPKHGQNWEILETDENGILDISYEKYGFSLVEDEKYYLEEQEAAPDYQLITFPYQFKLTQNADEVDWDQYIYFNGETFQIKNWPLEGLVIEKIVDVEEPEPEGESYKTKEYSFKLEILDQDGNVDTSVNTKYGKYDFVEGSTTFTLKDKQQALFKDMPKDTRFRVTETDSQGLVVWVGEGETSEKSEDGSYSGITKGGGEYTLVTFTNKKQDVGALKLTKEVTVNGEAPETDADKALANGDYTFTVTGPGNVNKAVVITVTGGAAESATIDGEEAEVGSDGYVVIGGLTPGVYTITESVPENGTKISKINGTATEEYSTTVTVAEGDTVSAEATASFTNDYKTVDLGVTKAWDPAAPKGAKVTLTLYKGETEGAATTVVDTIELDGTADTSAANVSGVNGATKQEDTAWHAQFTGLPKYEYVAGTDGAAGTVREIFYLVKETSGVSGFNAVYTKADGTTAEYADDGGTVTNTQEKGALKLTKEVTVNGAATTETSADGDYTFTITGPGSVSKTVVITVTNGEAASATIDGEPATLTDGYVVIGDLTPGDYMITETVPTNGTKISKINDEETTEYSTTVTVVAGDTAAAQASATFTNNYETTEIEVDKKWVNADGSDTWPDGVTIDIQLTADGTDVSGKTATLSADQPSYKFEKLPKYNSNGNEIAYSVKESKVPGYSGFAEAVADGKITITNTQGATQIEVEKKWVNADGTDTWPTGVTVEIQLTADGDPVSGKTATLSKDKPSHKFEGLPMYRADGKTEIEYSVKELKVSGYTSKVGETITGRITVTNTQETTEVVVDKKWVNADGTETWPDGVTVEIQLTSDGTEVSGKTAILSADQTSYTFDKLPKYQSDGKTEIVYSIEEPTKIAGYTSSVEKKEAGKFTVTNAYSATGTLNLEAEKKFKNGKLKEGEFTFELMDAGGKVLQSKTNDAAGKVAFDEIEYKLSDVAKAPFTYTVREVPGSRADVKYDATVYTVTVELKDKGDETLEVTKKIDNGGALKFENEQLNVETSVTIGGVKQLKGQTLKKDQFKFVLADENGKWLDTATNDAEGNFTFKPITYKLFDLNGEKTKVYSYSVWEVKGSESGITYDKTVYTVKVTVTDNGDGTMTAKADKAKSDIKFVNTTTEKKSKKTSSSKSSKTGDEAPLGVLFGGLGVGAIGLAVLLWNRKKKKDEE